LYLRNSIFLSHLFVSCWTVMSFFSSFLWP
jgi:hypothetical protein